MKANPTYRHFPPCAILWVCVITVLCFLHQPVKAQAVSQVITDYNGWWKTSSSSVNPILPDNHHNLLSFSFNGTSYSTGVNDALLTSHGETFVAGQYQALPLQNVNGTIVPNTKIGLGAMADGVANGPGAAPSRNLGPYLNDGSNGLDMGTCVANLPVGTMFMSVSNIQAGKIGDGIPDIVVTQVADPSTTFDSYEFTDINGVRIGNSLDIVLNNIPLVGNWMADFYEATGSTILSPGFTQTPRAIRLWAADFSVFGLNASNISSVAYFKINLSGQSDIAFVAYNTTTITVQQVLARNEPQRQARPIESAPAVTGLRLSPNPASGMVTVSHQEARSGEVISIYSNAGLLQKQVLCSARSSATQVDISTFRKGTYHIVLLQKNKKLVQQLVVQ